MRFIKVSTAGDELPTDAREWAMAKEAGLMWITTETDSMTHPEALEYVASLTTGGFTDWRLPTLEELAALVDDTRRPTIDTAYFPFCKPDWYWSATLHKGEAWFVNYITRKLERTQEAWSVNFLYASKAIGSCLTSEHFVRAVRQFGNNLTE